MSSTEPAISVRKLHKEFRIPNVQYSTLKSRVLHPFQRSSMQQFTALDDINFDIEPGEFFGVIGRNGSGKSTLLKLLADIYKPTSGQIVTHGDVASFIELGVGFNPELSGRENLFLNGALLGFSRKELRRRYRAIVEFAELEKFMGLKLRNYSSGMQVRLGFSIAVELGAPILLVDEVLAVGDERFQRKCYDVFRARKRDGVTVVFVSHDMGSIQEFCDRAMLLENGKQVALGSANEVARAYQRLNYLPGANVPTVTAQDFSDGPAASVTSVVLLNEQQERVTKVGCAEPITFAVAALASRAVEKPVVEIRISDLLGHALLAISTDNDDDDLPAWQAGDQTTVRFSFPNYLANGSYTLSASIRDGRDESLIDIAADAYAFDADAKATGAILDLPVTVTHQCEPAAGASARSEVRDSAAVRD